MTCADVQSQLTAYLDPREDALNRAVIAQHLAGCGDCRQAEGELQEIFALLKDRKAPELPEGFMEKLHLKLAQEPAPTPAGSLWLDRLKGLFNWPSLAAGAVAAAVLISVVNLRSPVPTIQTASVSEATQMAVNIGFDVDRDVDGVTFQIDLPEGLEFVDAEGQPVVAQSVSWQGELKRGKTVVPVTVRGTQPGRYEILATVRKNQMVRTTRIVVPVDPRQDSSQTLALLPVRGEV
ncbi:hypothetical protein D3C87_615520 [compost metagenome]